MGSARIKVPFATLNSGEQAPALRGRWDTKQYIQGVEKGRNVFSTVTGGLKRRPGLGYVGDMQGAEPIIDRRAVFIPYVDGSVDPISGRANGSLVVISFGQIKIYNALTNAVEATIVDSTYNLIQDEITWTQKTGGADIVLFHVSKQPRRLSIATGTWALSLLNFESIPQHHFEDTAGAVVTHVEFINIYNTVAGDRITIFLDGVETDWIPLSGVVATVSANIKAAIESLPNITVGDVTVVFVSGVKYRIVLAGSVDGRRFFFTPGEYDEQGAAADAITIFQTDTKGRMAEEDVWSGAGGGGPNDRGWPRCGAFFGNRLFMAGSTDRANTVWGSRFNNAEDFIVLEDPTDDSPIEKTADVEQGAAFNQAFVGRHLQFFASNAEFYVPKSESEALTPNNFVLRPTTSVGAMRSAPLVFFEDSTLYLQRDGRALRRFVFDETVNIYKSLELSIRGAHLLDVAPLNDFTNGALHGLPIRQFALQKSRGNEEPDRLYIINEAGNLICVTINLEEKVIAWHLWQTAGVFTHVTVVGDEVFVGVWRTDSLNGFPGAVAHYIEKFDNRLLVDSAEFDFDIIPPIAVSTDLVHLDTESPVAFNTVEIIVDGISQGTQEFGNFDTVAEFDPSALVDWQVGILFPDVKGTAGQTAQTWIRTLPLESESFGQPLIGEKKRVVDAILRLLDTGHVEVQGNELPLLTWVEAGDLSLHRQTGDFTAEALNDWDLFGQVDITQSKSEHLHLLAIAIRATVVEG